VHKNSGTFDHWDNQLSVCALISRIWPAKYVIWITTVLLISFSANIHVETKTCIIGMRYWSFDCQVGMEVYCTLS